MQQRVEQVHERRPQVRRAGPLLANFRDLGGGMAVARGNGAQVAARRAIQSPDSDPGLLAQLQKRGPWLPVVAPAGIEADALAQIGAAEFARLPGVKPDLVA